ncbi:hypothetical protein [Streptomyces cyanogenus]|uniref:Uncharacterized protein n=1 Tax=Streptomyces cyanogenus TaxID=80860 RepID=A0ABX7THB4_STRCY|nr:hypothetical protein [Streptomyces cyanogenus]QTD95814.1 hypothetical protein S1361_00580 [Streptomyces cyanogenus]
MLHQEATWTALPNGVTGTGPGRRLRLSVFVSPRVTSDQPSASLDKDFLDWPACVQPARISFNVQVSHAQPVTAAIVSPPAQSSLWKALFGASTPISGAGTDHTVTGRSVYSTYPIAELRDSISRGYGKLAADHSALLLDNTRLRSAFPELLSALGPDGERARTDHMGEWNMSDTGGDASDRLIRRRAAAASQLLRPHADTELSRRIAEATTLADRLAAAEPGTPVPVVAADGGAAGAYASLLAFHMGLARPLSGSDATPPGPVDFHSALTFLGEYPQVLRWLGLVIDLEVPVTSLPQTPAAGPIPLLKVTPTFTPPKSITSHSPWTAYRWDGRFFEAASKPPDTSTPAPQIVHGLLDLGRDGLFQAVDTDIDGSALKILHILAGHAHEPDTAADAALPALRSSGVTIAQAGRAQALVGHLLTTAARRDRLSRDDDVVLYAQDLVRGYRFDVLEGASTTWRSLHQRAGTYQFPPISGTAVVKTATDEGSVQPAITRAPLSDGSAPDPASPLHIHESVAHWQNWSLSAPRPGKCVTPDGPQHVTSLPAANGPPLTVSFQPVAHTLPRLRYGVSYQFRARVADLAGNGPTPADADAVLQELSAAHQDLRLPGGASGFVHRRLEPICPPVLVPCEEFCAGESESVLVIRSRTGQTAAQYAAALSKELAGHPGGGPRYRATCERHLVPPKVALAMAEEHGALDAVLAGPGGAPAAYALARREKGSIDDAFILDPVTGQPVPIPDSRDTDPVTGAVTQRHSVVIVTTGTTEAGPCGYAVHHEPQLQVPYLSDPAACGVALHGLPGLPTGGNTAGTIDPQGRLVFAPSPLTPDTLAKIGGSTVHIPFGNNWPQRTPLRLRVADAPTGSASPPPPSWDTANRVLTVYLAPAQQAVVTLSSFLSTKKDQAPLLDFALWRWILDASGGNPGQEAITMALQGGHRMLTPLHTVRLVHAVEAPLAAPALELRVLRAPGAPFAYLGGTVKVNGASTAKIDLMATWTEYTDDGAQSRPPQQCTRQVLEVPVPLPGEPAAPPDASGAVPVAVYTPPPADTITFQAPATADPPPARKYTARHEFGDTRHRKVTYRATATSRFRECFPEHIAADPTRLSLAGNTVTVDVLSSERPATPEVVSVLPAFRWFRSTDANGTRHSVRHGAIRVYLDRPWYSSGEGELLGVVTADSGSASSSLPAGFITHWGTNPVFGAPGPTATPQPSVFPGTVTGVHLMTAEFPGGPPVAVAGHRVGFDAKRQLWYCDIDTSPALDDSYFPFVRLALARYQPSSLPGRELSRVVHTAYVRTAPRRTVTLKPVQDTPHTYDLLVEGPSYVSTEWKADLKENYSWTHLPGKALPRASVDVVLDTRIPGLDDDLGWTENSSVPPAAAVIMGVGPAPASGTPLWRGRFTLPPSAVPGQTRIRIEEHEFFTQHTVNTTIPGDPSDFPGVPPGHVPRQPYAYEYPGERTVFAETIVL